MWTWALSESCQPCPRLHIHYFCAQGSKTDLSNQHGHGHIQGLRANVNKNGRRRGDQNENEDWSNGFEHNFDVILYKFVKLLKVFCS